MKNMMEAPCPIQQAWVVFNGQTDMNWLKILKPGFRHCFVLLNDGQKWMTLDPMLNHMEAQIHHDVPPEFDLPSWIKKQGETVIKAPLLRDHMKPAPVMLFTCVEAIKRVLGIHKLSVVTPWQLYCYLKNQNHQNKGDLLWDH